MIITIGVLVFLVVDNDVNESSTSIEQSKDISTSYIDESTSQENATDKEPKESKAANSSKLYAENTSNSNNQAVNNSSYANTGSSYYQDNSNYESASPTYGNNATSYNQDTSYYGDTSSSYENNGTAYSQDNSNTGNNSAGSQKNNSNTVNNNPNNNAVSKDSKISEANDTNDDSETTEEENTENLKYQRLYDNGIMWYGNTGTLMIEYQSSHSQTTGIGFRVHFDSSSIRPVNITQFPVDAIITTTPNTVMADGDNRDNNAETDSFLPFAWASIYGQWPQTNELNLASIDFEKVNGGSNNYTVNYSVVSVPAGFQLIK